MHRVVVFWSAMALVGALAAGCSDDDGDGSVTIDNYPARYAATFCQNLPACCESSGEPFEWNSCQASVEESMDEAFAQARANPNLVFDETRASECLEALEATLQGCTDRTLAAKSAPICQSVMRGTLPLGEACEDASECEGEVGSVACDGTCVPVESPAALDEPHAALGEPCSQTCEFVGDVEIGCSATSSDVGGVCWIGDGLHCADGTCQSLPAVGESCLGTPCAPGGYCDDLSTCAAQKPDGDACETDLECLGGACDGTCRQWSFAGGGFCSGGL